MEVDGKDANNWERWKHENIKTVGKDADTWKKMKINWADMDRQKKWGKLKKRWREREKERRQTEKMRTTERKMVLNWTDEDRRKDKENWNKYRKFKKTSTDGKGGLKK